MTATKKRLGKGDLWLLGFVLVFVVCLMVPLFSSSTIWAGEIRKLTDVFETQSFRGGAEALKNANAIGKAMHYIISWFSFLGLCLTLYQKFITLLYLSSRNLFDAVYDIKVNKMSGPGMGYKNLLTQLFKDGENGGRMGGGGLDVFITFAYSLLPNVKAYCDFAPESSFVQRYGTEATDRMDVTQYMLKTAIPTIMLIFFLTIGYSGTLAKAYGTIVDGMAVAADHFVDKNFAAWVSQQLAGMDAYDWTIGQHASEQASYAEQVARTMWGEVVVKCGTNLPEGFKRALGKVIEDTVWGGDSAVTPVALPWTVSGATTSAPGAGSGKGILGGAYVVDDPMAKDGRNLNAQLNALVRATLFAAGEASDKNSYAAMYDILKTDQDYRKLLSPQVEVTSNSTGFGNSIVWKLDDIVHAAGRLSGYTDIGSTDLYLAVTSRLNLQNSADYMKTIPKTEPGINEYGDVIHEINRDGGFVPVGPNP